MDRLLPNSGLNQTEPQRSVSVSVSELIEQGIGFFRRQYPVIFLILTCALVLGLVYLFTAAAQYTAHAMLLIDTSKTKVLQQQQQAFGDLPLDTAQVDTQLELLKSEAIGLSVVKELKLTEDPEFVSSGRGLRGAIVDLISRPFSFGTDSAKVPDSEYALSRRALGRLLGNRAVRRVARTYVLDISYTSYSSASAASIANAIAESYIVDQLESKYQATRRASIWLQERIAELRVQALTADRAVLEFKEQKKIIGTGGSDGRLLGEQQVLDLNAQLSTARATKAEAKARLDRIKEVMGQDIPDAAVADSLRNEIINRLRSQYLEYDRRYNILASRYGSSHLAAVNLRTQMVELKRSMADELSRMSEGYKSDFEIAKTREESLEANLSLLISGTQLTNRDRLGLQDLESKAKVYHSIHDSFLQRYMEITQQQSFPMTEARVITMATPPPGKSSPQTFRVLALAGALGFILGLAVAGLRESIDRVFRTTRQVEKILHTNCLAVLPIVKDAVPSGTAAKSAASRNMPPGPLSAKRLRPDLASIFRHVIHEPLSSFAEGFRAIKVAADISGSIKENKVIGVTSSLPGEGKSTTACNLAELIAHGGNKVILVDGDLRNPTLTRKLVVQPDLGLIQVIGGKVDLRQALHTDEMSGLDFLPAVIESRLAHSSEILASDAFKHLIDSLRKSYDYVIVDLPPLAPVVDVRATTKIIDSYVFVIEWGRTRLNMVERQFNSAPEIFDRLLGVVLNKANVRILDRYEDYYGRYYYKKYYANYGYSHS